MNRSHNATEVALIDELFIVDGMDMVLSQLQQDGSRVFGISVGFQELVIVDTTAAGSNVSS